MKIYFFEVNDWQKEFLKKQLPNHDIKFFNTHLTKENVSKIKDCEVLSSFIFSKIDKEIINQLPNLKLIATMSTGFDHINLETCKQKNITVCNVPFYGENTVAEHTFGLILSLSRNIHKSYLRTLNNDFSIEGLTGFDLKGKTIGIIGGGHIGLHVARIAKAFSMNVLVFDINKDNFLSEVLGFKYAKMDDLLASSDIISLHVPHNKHTHHLINKEKIKKIKKGAILINTSRGEIVDTNALFEALEDNILSGAGLDVIEGEQLIKEEKSLLHSNENCKKWKELVKSHEILKMDNVVFTPHNAFNSKEALRRILKTTAENILHFEKDNIKNCVSIDNKS